MKLKFILLSVLFVYSGIVIGQDKSSFSIYVFKKRYNKSGQTYIGKQSMFRNIDILGSATIDPKNEGLINLTKIEKDLIKIYPNKNDAGTLCLDIENILFSNLQKFNPGSDEYSASIIQFSKMIDLVKSLRPNVKVGIYGLPYRVFYKSQNVWNSNKKLDPILKKTDLIFPSLYILYPDRQKGLESNNAYWKQNLDNAFEYGERLNKPVVPFIWYMVTGNKVYGTQILSENEVTRYLKFIQNYTSKNNSRINGVVWWESSPKIFLNGMKQNNIMQKSASPPITNSDILIKYTGAFINYNN